MIKEEISKRLKDKLNPIFLEITNNSSKHSKHLFEASLKNAETHFHIKIGSSVFNNVKRLQRHQLVYNILSDLINNPIHALSLELLDQNGC